MLICGGWKVTKNVKENAMVFATNFYQSNIVKFTECNNTKQCSTCNENDFRNDGVYLQAKTPSLNNALDKMLISKINRVGSKYKCFGWKIFYYRWKIYQTLMSKCCV